MKTKTEYVRVERNADGGKYWECSRDFSEGEIGTFWRDPLGTQVIQDNDQLLACYKSGNIYRKVETVINWQEKLAKHFEEAFHPNDEPYYRVNGDGSVRIDGRFEPGQFIETCRIVIASTDGDSND